MISRLSPYVTVYCLVLAAGISLRGASPVHAQDVSVRAYFAQSGLVVNQAAQISVEVSGSDARNAGQPEFPDLGDWFRIGGSRGTSQNFSWINGKMTFSVTYNYDIIPLKPGRTTVPPFSVTVKGKRYASEPLTVEIRSAGTPPPPQPGTPPPRQAAPSANAPADIFIVAVPDKQTVYQNEGVTVEYKVYFGAGISIREYAPLNTPNTAGFWTEKYTMPGSPRAYPETYNNRNYNAAVLQRVELFPTKAGEFVLDPIQMQFTVRLPRQRSNPFDSFFNDSFFGSLKNISVSSNKLKITAKPLPDAGRPASFRGEVGRYTISASVDKNQVRMNESVTLTVTVSGTGNIKLINEPVIDFPETFEQYDPKVDEKINRGGSTISGSKTFEYVLIPRKTGRYTINPVSLAYFDPDSKVYKTARSTPLTVDVSPGAVISSNIPRNLSREEIKLLGQDVRYIKESVASWQKTGGGNFASVAFLSLLFAPLLIIGMSHMYSRHLDRLSSDIGYKRSRSANAVAAKRLKKARSYMEKNNADAFFPEIARALQDYIADKLNIAAAGIVTDELETMLRRRAVDPDLVDAYISCLRTSDFHRFSTVTAGQEEMKSLYESSRRAVFDMENRLKKSA